MSINRRIRSLNSRSRRAARQLAEFIDTAGGARNKDDAFLTKKDAEELVSAGIGVNRPLNITSRTGSKDRVLNNVYPSMPAGIIAHIRYEAINLSWSRATYEGHSRTEVWRAPTRNLDDATLLGYTDGTSFSDSGAGHDQTWTYFLRNIAAPEYGGMPGPFAAGVVAVSAEDPLPDLITQIDRMDGGVLVEGSIKNQIDAERQQTLLDVLNERQQTISDLLIERQQTASDILSERQQTIQDVLDEKNERNERILQEREERLIEQRFAAAIDRVLAQANNTQHATIRTLETIRKSADEALTHQMDVALSRIGNNESAIINEKLTRANQTASLASQIGLLRARIESRIVFASGWEDGQDFSRWTEETGALLAETDDVFTGLQSGLLNGEISTTISVPTADSFSGKQSVIRLAVKNIDADKVEIKYIADTYDTDWLEIEATTAWAEYEVPIAVPVGINNVTAEVRIKTTDGAALVDALLIEPIDSELPEITAEIERLGLAIADIEENKAEATEISRIESAMGDRFSLVENEVSSKVNSSQVTAQINSALTAKNYDNLIAGLDQEQSVVIQNQEASSERIDRLFAESGFGDIGSESRQIALAKEFELSLIVDSVIAARNKSTDASIQTTQEIITTETSALAVQVNTQGVSLGKLDASFQNYKRTAIGYCVDSSGNITKHNNAASCELVGNTWKTASLAEASERISARMNEGRFSSIEQTMQTKVDDTEVVAIIGRELLAEDEGAFSSVLEEIQTKITEEGAESIIQSHLESGSEGLFAGIYQTMGTKTNSDQVESLITSALTAKDYDGNIADLLEYKRSAIGYCVDSNGNPTNHNTAASCELASHTWVTAPLAETMMQTRVSLPDGSNAKAGAMFQSLIDDTGDLKNRASLFIDTNGRLAGLFLNGSETSSSLDVLVDSFRIKTSGNDAVPFEVIGSNVYMKDVIIDDNIKGGKTSFSDTTAGFWLGKDSGTHKMLIGDANNYIKWGGNNIELKGILEIDTIYCKAPIKTKATSILGGILSGLEGRTSVFYEYRALPFSQGPITIGELSLPWDSSPLEERRRVTSTSGILTISIDVYMGPSRWVLEYRVRQTAGSWTSWKEAHQYAPAQSLEKHEATFNRTNVFIKVPLFEALNESGLINLSDYSIFPPSRIQFRLRKTDNYAGLISSIAQIHSYIEYNNI